MTTQVDLWRSDFNTSGAVGVGGFGDLLWRDHAGDIVLWLMDGNTPGPIAALPFVTPDWHVKATANFDNPAPFISNPADILWQNDDGALALWQMAAGPSGPTVSAIRALPNPGPTWHVVGDNDFNFDSSDDILFRNDNGSVVIWTITSAAGPTISGMFTNLQNPGPTWHVVATGDIDGDRKAGVLWQNDSGALALWENPTFAAGRVTFNTVAALPTVDPSWHVKGIAGIGGHDDIVFQHDSGAVAIWVMSGTTVADTKLVNLDPGPSWHIVGLRDMNGDFSEDIVFQNDNGAAAVWENYQSLGSGSATFNTVFAINPNPNPNGHVWDLL